MPKGTKIPRAAYAIDWLQISVEVPMGLPPAWEEAVSPQSDKSGNHRFYSLRESSYYIRGFEWQREICCNGYVVAHIACQPRTEHLPLFAGALKLENATLYVADWYFILTDILSVLRWVPKKITRLDLCADFNYFVGGLLPSTFLRNYIRKQDASYLRIGSNKFCVYGIKDMHTTSYDSIRWGSRQNGVSVYMYNKSRELMEVKNKPHIRALWKAHDLSTVLDVWRVEISITSQGLGLKSATDSMFHHLFVDDLAEPNACRDLFKVYAAKYFRFLKTERGAKRKRDLKEVQLLDLTTDCPLRPHDHVEHVDSGRMEKIVSRRLHLMYEAVQQGECSDKAAMADALAKVIQLYDSHYDIKEKVTWQNGKLQELFRNPLLSSLHLPLKEEAFYNLTRARKNLSRWERLAQLLAKSITKEIENAHSPSPPPRAAARNSISSTTSPIPTSITPEWISDFVGRFFTDEDFV